MKSLFRYTSFTITLIFILSCGEKNNHQDDFIPVHDLNLHVEKSDLKRGIKKTGSSMPPVYFSHNIHEKQQVKCIQCHHKKGNPERVKRCAWCHRGQKESELIHTLCITCHKKKEAPVLCSGCHKAKKERLPHSEITDTFKGTFSFDDKEHAFHKNAGYDCRACHHEKSEKPHKCADCHDAATKVRVYHIFCRDCHRKVRRGPVKCKECHKIKSSPLDSLNDIIVLQKTGHRKPPIRFDHRAHMEDYNTECIDCHHLGSMKKCSECHKKKDRGAVINLKIAFHQQCHDCHRRTSGPRACINCHRGNKK